MASAQVADLLDRHKDRAHGNARDSVEFLKRLLELARQILGAERAGAFVVREDGRIDEVLAPRPRRLRRK